MKEALLKGNIAKFAEILERSWQEKQKLANDISNSEINMLMSEAKKVGALAGKVSGAGGGGFIMFIVDPVKKMELVTMLTKKSGTVVNFNFEKQGVQSWLV